MYPNNEIKAIKDKYIEIAAKARENIRAGKSDTDLPEIILNG
jgi:hypothetical protein